MIVEQIYAHNSLRNFNYIIACENTKEAIVIDPLKVEEITNLAEKNKYKIIAIINTHEHADHTDGNFELIKYLEAKQGISPKVYCHHKATKTVPGATDGLSKGDIITIGDSVKLEALDTPGHTLAHVCLLASNDSSPKALFCGDTLFNAGAGNVYSGNVDELFDTFEQILAKLPDNTIIYPGHDYLANNLEFTLSVEPDNATAKSLLKEIDELDSEKTGDFYITNMCIEKQINTFFRLNSCSIISHLGFDKDAVSRQDIFRQLRTLRNNW